MEVSIFSRYIPSVNGVEFDADFGANVRFKSKFSSYPLENGFVINNALIPEQSVVRLKMGIGKERMTGLLTDPLQNVAENWDSYLTGLLSNFVGAGLTNFLLGLFSNSFFASSDRTGKALQSLQALQLAGESFDLLIHNMGTLKNMMVTDIQADTSPDTADAVLFSVELKQKQSPDLNRSIEVADPPDYLGEIKGTTEEITDNISDTVTGFFS